MLTMRFLLGPEDNASNEPTHTAHDHFPEGRK